MRMLDLFCGRFGWGKAFAARGWEVVGVDLVEPPEVPEGCQFVQGDISEMHWSSFGPWIQPFDFICASSPCQQFSQHGLRCFFPEPKYPELGISLFNHTRAFCERSGLPYVMENVRAAEAFVGPAVNHCGPFYLWGSGVPPILPQGIQKNWQTRFVDSNGRQRTGGPGRDFWAGSEKRKNATAQVATIPSELAGAVADYATRLCEVTA